MANFNNLKKLEVVGTQTARLTLYQLEGEPVLIVAPAGEVNKEYFNGLLKRSRKNMRRIQSQQFTAGLVSENRDDDRRLYSLHIIKDWERIVDESGQEVKCNSENALQFLEALPDWLFDDVRNFCTNMQNFLDVPDPEIVAGNSESV